MTATRFRLALPTEAEALADFMTRNFLATYGACSTPANVAATVDRHYGVAAQRRQLADAGCANLLAEVDGEIAGLAQLRFDSQAPPGVEALPALEISRFYVDTAWQGRGIAQALMAEARRIAEGRGAKALWLSCWQEQPQAIRFYAKEGFRIAGTLVFAIGDDPKDDWLMVQAL
jgi:GNAT superfamily N-acetyltransferase